MKKNISLLLLIFLISCKKTDENALLAMNNVKMPPFEEIKHVGNSKDTLKILILGNSITSHGIAPDIGWKHKSGMAASSESKDYVHLLSGKLSSTYPDKNIIVRYSNYSEVERAPEKFIRKDWSSISDFKPDKLIFQLSDNTTKEKSNIFKKSSLELLKQFKGSDIYVVSPFFINNDNYNVSKSIALESEAVFIDLKDISDSDQNKAVNEKKYPAEKSSWMVEGIGLHPGDTGMLNISELIYKTIISKN